MFDTVRFRYNIPLKVYHPDTHDIDNLMSKHGAFSFKQSVKHREECCFLRKVKPARKALLSKKVWIAGLRREQSAARKNIPFIEYLEDQKIYKVNPLANWSREQLDSYVKENNVPVHPLYEQGYLSIGCSPCTRPVSQGEDERAGRWWWEQETNKECGINTIR